MKVRDLTFQPYRDLEHCIKHWGKKEILSKFDKHYSIEITSYNNDDYDDLIHHDISFTKLQKLMPSVLKEFKNKNIFICSTIHIDITEDILDMDPSELFVDEFWEQHCEYWLTYDCWSQIVEVVVKFSPGGLLKKS